MLSKFAADVKARGLNDLILHIRTPLYWNGYALIVSTALTSGLGLVYWAVAAHFNSSDDVGLNSAAISIMIFLSSVSQLNFQGTLIRYVPVAGRATQRLVGYSYLITLALSALLGLIFCIGIPLWAPALAFINGSATSILWFVLAVMTWGIFSIQDSVLTGLRQTVWVPIENAIFAVIKIGFLVLFAALLPHYGIFVSWTLSVLLTLIPVNYYVFRRFIPMHAKATQDKTEPIRVGEVVRYVAGNYVGSLFNSMSTALVPLIIVQVAGATANAHFYLTWTIASSLQIIAANMATSLTVEATIDQSNFSSYGRRALIGIARLLVPIVVLVIVFAPIILRLFGPTYVEEGTGLLQLLALSALPSVINVIYIGLARVKNQIGGIIMTNGAIAVLVLGLSYVFLKSYGIAGVGLAWLVSQTAVAAFLLLTQRELFSVRRTDSTVPSVPVTGN